MSTSANIIVFVNKSITPDLGTKILGHVGWGFLLPDGNWLFGSKEATPKHFEGHFPGTIPKGQPNGVFIRKASFQEMVRALGNPSSKGPVFRYDEYKLMAHPSPDPNAAIRKAKSSKGWGYGAIGNNCMDDVYAILTAYACGNQNYMPWPSTNPRPNGFYDAIKGTRYKV